MGNYSALFSDTPRRRGTVLARTSEGYAKAYCCHSLPGWLPEFPLHGIRPSSGNLRLKPLMDLAYQRKLGGASWAHQFLFVFRITGVIIQNIAFPECEKALRRKPFILAKIDSPGASRFRDRAAKSGFKNGPPPPPHTHTPASMEVGHVTDKEGWATGPFPLSSRCKPFELPTPLFKVDFRPVPHRADVLRSCDDLRYCMANLA